MADRYTYLPSIGLSVLVVWGVADWVEAPRRHGRLARALATGLAVCAIAILAVRSHFQIQPWRDSLALYTHAYAERARESADVAGPGEDECIRRSGGASPVRSRTGDRARSEARRGLQQSRRRVSRPRRPCARESRAGPGTRDRPEAGLGLRESSAAVSSQRISRPGARGLRRGPRDRALCGALHRSRSAAARAGQVRGGPGEPRDGARAGRGARRARRGTQESCVGAGHLCGPRAP